MDIRIQETVATTPRSAPIEGIVEAELAEERALQDEIAQDAHLRSFACAR